MDSSMGRREFTKIVVGGVAGAGLLGAAAACSPRPARNAPRKNTLHHVGGDYHVIMTDTRGWWERQDDWAGWRNFNWHERYGVHHFTNIMRPGAWDFDQMRRWKDICDRYGKVWEMIRMDDSYIHLPPGDERERKLAEIAENIRKASRVDVKYISMHWRMIPIRRNLETPGRGGSTYTSFRLEEDWQDLPVERQGVVSYDDYWERITAFLTAIIPVCEEVGVPMAVHPYDPPGLPRGYQGVDNWNAGPESIFESLKRYEAVVDSPYNGFQLCLGTVMEGLRNPKTELLPIVRYFAEKGKIFQIHMRNIRGGLHNFEEVHIDEGEADFIEVVRLLRDTGYTGSYCPDHVPSHPDDPQYYQGFAHAFGYIQSLIDTANHEVA